MWVFIESVVEFSQELWADKESRIALLVVLTLTILLLWGLIATNPPVDWST